MSDIPTPFIGHLTAADYEHVYEPAEDSFILLDALEGDADAIRSNSPSLCVEIGSGSGVVSTFLAILLGPNTAATICTDINAHAIRATARTGGMNNISLDPLLCNLLDPLQTRLQGQIDILLYNPPYVETDTNEMHTTQAAQDLGGAWAGGNLGMGVTRHVIPKVGPLLSAKGRFYLVAVAQNRPQDIVKQLEGTGLSAEIILHRKAGREHLYVIRAMHSSQAC